MTCVMCAVATDLVLVGRGAVPFCKLHYDGWCRSPELAAWYDRAIPVGKSEVARAFVARMKGEQA